MNNDTIWLIVLVASIALMINGLGDVNDPDKKTAQAGQTSASTGAAGLAAVGLKAATQTGDIFLGIGSGIWKVIAWPVAALVGIFTTQVAGAISPGPTIPTWVWFVAFFVIILIVLKLKK